MRAIKTDMSREELNRLETAAMLLSTYGLGTTEVAETWFDYGAGIKWLTLITTRTDGDSYQTLYPNVQEKILFGTMDEMTDAVKEIICDMHNRGW